MSANGPLPERETRRAILALAGATTAADDQARAMTDLELADLLLSGRWTTIEIHEAGRRLMRRSEIEDAAAKLFERLEREDDPIWDGDQHYDRLGAALLARRAIVESRETKTNGVRE